MYTGDGQPTIKPEALNKSTGDTAVFNCSWPNALHFLCFVNDTNVDVIQNIQKYLNCTMHDHGTIYASTNIAVKLSEESVNLFNNSNISCQTFGVQNAIINRPTARLIIQGKHSLQFSHLTFIYNFSTMYKGLLDPPTLLKSSCRDECELCMEWNAPYTLENIDVQYNVTYYSDAENQLSSEMESKIFNSISSNGCVLTTHVTCDTITKVCIQAVTSAGQSSESCGLVNDTNGEEEDDPPTPNGGQLQCVKHILLCCTVFEIALLDWS